MINILESENYPSINDNFFQSIDFINILNKIGWKTISLDVPGRGGNVKIFGFAPKTIPIYSHFFPRFLVLYGPIFSENIDSGELDELLKQLCNAAKKHGAVTLDIRTPFPYPYCSDVFLENGFDRKIEGGEYSAFIDLTKDKSDLFKGLNQNARRCVRRARDFGVKIQSVEDEDDLTNFHTVYAETGRRRGFYPYPFTLFESLWKELETTKKVKFFTAYYDDKPAAVILNTFHGKESVPYIMGSLSEYWKYYPNHLLVWHSMIWSKEEVGSSIFKFYHLPAKRDLNANIDYYSFKASFGGKVIEECTFYRKIFSHPKKYFFNLMDRFPKSFIMDALKRLKPM